MKKKKLLFVINTLSAAGAEMSFLQLLRQLDPKTYDIDVYVLLAQGELREQLPAYVHLQNKSYSDCSVLSKEGKRHLVHRVLCAALYRGTVFFQLPYLFRTFIAMCKKRRLQPDKLLWQLLAQGTPAPKKEYDLAVAYLEGGSAYYVADRVRAKKKAAFIHIDYARAGYTRAIDRDCYLCYDHIFTVSGEGQRTFLDSYPQLKGKLSLFHNPIDRDAMIEKSHELCTHPAWNSYHGKKLLTVGRLNPQKAYEVAIETMRLLKKNGADVRWYVLGEGAERERLEQLIRRYGLEEDFRLLGAVDNPYPYYAGCDLYVHATRFEGRSVAIQEAQALGCAVLASDCSGNREQITDDVDGRLVALDPPQIAEQIRAMLADPLLLERLGAAAAKKPTSHPEDIEELLSLTE
ncbi:MAG: glycosyltransferase [Lachnospiraceae bacterium]|nr:glycosyltransferase [bacterium]MDY5517406.1 glycosyltransferase [Lachnospiraceae bacterium]